MVVKSSSKNYLLGKGLTQGIKTDRGFQLKATDTICCGDEFRRPLLDNTAFKRVNPRSSRKDVLRTLAC